jgi:hypothetical protein
MSRHRQHALSSCFATKEAALRTKPNGQKFQQPFAPGRELSAIGLIRIAGPTMEEIRMKYALIIATVAAIATPALADDVGVRVGPVGAGVSVGESHDRDRDRDRTVIKEREPDRDRTTVIKKEHSDGDQTKTVIHHDRD